MRSRQRKGIALALVIVGLVGTLLSAFYLLGNPWERNRELEAWKRAVSTLSQPFASNYFDPGTMVATGSPIPPVTPPEPAPTQGVTSGAILRLRIESAGIDVLVYEGIDTRTLRRGPGHFTETAMPGEGGNTVISGHRTTYGGPFANLNSILVDTEIIIQDRRGEEYTYRVEWVRRVSPEELWVTKPTKTETLTLTTCDPPFSSRSRLVVRAIRAE